MNSTMKNEITGKTSAFSIQAVEGLLNKRGYHIYSKDYGDGTGRKYWVRNSKQKIVIKLTFNQFKEVNDVIKTRSIKVFSSDRAFWLEK